MENGFRHVFYGSGAKFRFMVVTGTGGDPDVCINLGTHFSVLGCESYMYRKS